ncbi:MAG: hypothetical protein BGO39_03440 [Chloroflexi bacterium 54-19]|nr:MAG: hypothetical protein BGO39_03440 [Chloroflexi bacterium 54-19]
MNENQKPKSSPDLMRLAAQRGSSRPEFLGFLFNLYRQDKNLSTQELASQLGATEDTLNFLSLCRPPASGTEVGPSYKEYIQNISRELEVDQKKLSSIIRNAMNIRRLQESQITRPTAAASQQALAARDRLEDADVPIEAEQDIPVKEGDGISNKSEDESK